MILESLLLNLITHAKGEHGYSKILHMMVKDGSSAFLTLFLLFSDGTLDSTCRNSILCLHMQYALIVTYRSLMHYLIAVSGAVVGNLILLLIASVSGVVPLKIIFTDVHQPQINDFLLM